MPNPIACHIAVGKLLDFAADRLPADERASLERHLAACPSCRLQAADYRRLVALMAEAGQAPLPPSRADWQMLATCMEATSGAQRKPVVLPGIKGRLALAGIAILALLSRIPDRTRHAWHSKQPGVTLTGQPTPTPQNRFAVVPPPLRRHSALPNIQMARHTLREEDRLRFRPSTPASRHPRFHNRQSEQVRGLLAQAARQIDALERRQRDEPRTFVATFNSEGTLHLVRNSASIQVTVLTPGQGLVDNHTAFQPDGMTGGTWVRQTLREEPDGERTTETIAAVFDSNLFDPDLFDPDRPDGFLDLQTCSTPRRRLEGESQP
jgi:hypothetical protein